MENRGLSQEREAKLNKEIADFEQMLESRQSDIEKERAAYYKAKAERTNAGGELPKSRKRKADSVTVYNAKTAAKKFKPKRVFKESFIHRTIRLLKGLSKVRKEVRASKKQMPLTAEKRAAKITAVFEDAWQPITSFFKKMVNDFWEFLVELWEDFVEIILFFVNTIIAIGYYIGSFFLYIWDIFWDIRIWVEARKSSVFQFFTISVGLVAIALIAVSSLTAYEYSYYGRSLGIARSKQEVYQTIDALGDKLSEASGANININVERDIEFARVVGFNMDVDSTDDILNTLTYMKDIQVRASAINLNGKQTVVLENEETANLVLQIIRNTYAPDTPGVEYTQITYDQTIETEDVGVLLGEIWNPNDAIKYLTTGSTKDLDPEEEAPLITMRTVEIATYNKEVNFGKKYIDSPEYYVGETELIKQGSVGINEEVAEITRVNGSEIKRVLQSSKRTKNPVDALYYNGTKPVPEKKGTGTFIWPVKNTTRRMITSRFGNRNTGIVGATTNHQGMDIGAPTGTKIYASDGGVVTFAGWRSGYGYVVEIDHGGLYVTRYGHCSKMLVSAGDEVFQGQNIALVGSTGVSSGPHCHFEIRFNDVAKNPIEFLPALE